MYPLKAARKPIPQSTVDYLTETVLKKILSKCEPSKVYLFGSAALGKFTDQSDIDMLLIFNNDLDIKAAQKKLKGAYPLDKNIPIDLVWVSIDRFDEMKDRGGVCFVASTEGKVLYAAETK